MIFETVFADFLTLCDATNGPVIKKNRKKPRVRYREAKPIRLNFFTASLNHRAHEKLFKSY